MRSDFVDEFVSQKKGGNLWLYRRGDMSQARFKFCAEEFARGQIPRIPPDVEEVIRNKV